MLITNMTLVLGFGQHRKQLQIGKLHFCTFATSPLAALACLVSPGIFFSGRSRQPDRLCSVTSPNPTIGRFLANRQPVGFLEKLE